MRRRQKNYYSKAIINNKGQSLDLNLDKVHYMINLDPTMQAVGSPLRFKSGNSHNQMGDTTRYF